MNHPLATPPRSPDVERLMDQLRKNGRLPPNETPYIADGKAHRALNGVHPHLSFTAPEPEGPGLVAQLAGVIACALAFVGCCAVAYGAVEFALWMLTLNAPVGR